MTHDVLRAALLRRFTNIDEVGTVADFSNRAALADTLLYASVIGAIQAGFFTGLFTEEELNDITADKIISMYFEKISELSLRQAAAANSPKIWGKTIEEWNSAPAATEVVSPIEKAVGDYFSKKLAKSKNSQLLIALFKEIAAADMVTEDEIAVEINRCDSLHAIIHARGHGGKLL